MQIELVGTTRYDITYRTKISHLKIIARLESGEYHINFPAYDSEKILKKKHPISHILRDFTVPLFGAEHRSKSIIAELQKEIEDEIDRQFDRYDFNRESLIIDALEDVILLA